MRFIYILILIFLNNPSAKADYTEACFEDALIAGNALRAIDFLKTNTDKILLVGGCLKIETSSSRISLFQKYLRKNFPVSFMDLSTSVPTQNCHIRLRKVIEKKQETKSIGTNKFNAHKKESKTTNVSKIVLAEGLKSEIKYRENRYEITCFLKGNGYTINVNAKSKTLGINTTRYIEKGKEVELGDIITQSKNQEGSIDNSKGIEFSNTNSNKFEKIYLSVE